MAFIDDLKWRYACKIMNGRKVGQEEIKTILESIRLAPTSVGMQLFKVFVIEDRTFINKLFEESAGNQNMLPGCSHLLVFAAFTTFTNEMVNEYIERFGQVRNFTGEHLEQYRDRYMAWKDAFGTEEQIVDWTSRQTYIAMSYATIAAANLKIDATPVEGFIPEKADEILDLKRQNLRSTLMLPLGYRDEVNDRSVNAPKVRKDSKDLFVFK